MDKNLKEKFTYKKLAILVGVLLIVGFAVWFYTKRQPGEILTAQTSSYAMSTIISQTGHGENPSAALNEVNRRLLAIEQQLSLYNTTSYIAKINAAAGVGYVTLPNEVYALLKDCVYYSGQSDGAFKVTIGPITNAWGVTSDTPRVVPKEEIAALLPLVNDDDILFDDANHAVMLAHEGQVIDLGGIAKGWACYVAFEVYEEYSLQSAWLSIGGNVVVYGRKQNGEMYPVGFRNPEGGEQSYIASVKLENAVFAVSGGYERFFEEEGVVYQHIMDPATGAPAVSDVVSVGVISDNGTYADFMSTTLYVWGVEKTIAFMETQPECGIILLAPGHKLYVSNSLEGVFTLAGEGDYEVLFV